MIVKTQPRLNQPLTQLDIVEILNNIVKLDDQVTVGAELAALFLGMSEKSLARYRQNGSGPPYLQYPKADSTARNQKVNYLMGELRKWRNQSTITSTMDAAVRRGLSFFTLSDVQNAQPFWVQSTKILNHVMDSDIETFVANFKNKECAIVWLSWSRALEQPWLSRQYKDKFLQPYILLLSRYLDAVKTA